MLAKTQHEILSPPKLEVKKSVTPLSSVYFVFAESYRIQRSAAHTVTQAAAVSCSCILPYDLGGHVPFSRLNIGTVCSNPALGRDTFPRSLRFMKDRQEFCCLYAYLGSSYIKTNKKHDYRW